MTHLIVYIKRTWSVRQVGNNNWWHSPLWTLSIARYKRPSFYLIFSHCFNRECTDVDKPNLSGLVGFFCQLQNFLNTLSTGSDSWNCWSSAFEYPGKMGVFSQQHHLLQPMMPVTAWLCCTHLLHLTSLVPELFLSWVSHRLPQSHYTLRFHFQSLVHWILVS